MIKDNLSLHYRKAAQHLSGLDKSGEFNNSNPSLYDINKIEIIAEVYNDLNLEELHILKEKLIQKGKLKRKF